MKYIYLNPNGAPCFCWKRPCFGGVDLQTNASLAASAAAWSERTSKEMPRFIGKNGGKTLGMGGPLDNSTPYIIYTPSPYIVPY